MKKIVMVGLIILVICASLGVVSADDDWSFNWSSSDSSNSDGGQISFDNGKLIIQGIELTIPDGYKENQSAQRLAEDAADMEDVKYSACSFLNDGKEIVAKVFFADDSTFDNLTPDEDGSSVEKTMAGIDGIYFENKYGDGTPTFEYIKDGKIVEVNAPDDETLEAVIK